MRTITMLRSWILIFATTVLGWSAPVKPDACIWGQTLTGADRTVSFEDSSRAIQLLSGEALGGVATIAAGSSHGLILTSDGSVVGFGWNSSGQALGSPSSSPAAGPSPVVLDGKVLSGIKAISAGRTHSLALRDNGTVVAWGKLLGGESVNPPPHLTNITAIAAGWNRNLALKEDGTVVQWPRTNLPAGLSNIMTIATGGGGYGPSMALRQDGTVFVWGATGREELVPEGVGDVIAVAAGAGHCMALRSDGTVYGWRGNNVGQATGIPTKEAPFRSEGVVKLGGSILTNVVSITAGSRLSLALKADGEVVMWGKSHNRHLNAIPQRLSGVNAIAAGENFCAALTTNGLAITAGHASRRGVDQNR